jgi:uncharacterized membrane protein YbaN (DUF454 family)
MSSYNSNYVCNPQTDQTETYDDLHDEISYEVASFLDHMNSLDKNVTIFIMIFTILGNTLVLIATWREKSLHQPNKYFVACLAVADLMVGLFVAPIWLHEVIIKEGNHDHDTVERSIHLCRFIVWIDTCTLTASIYTLTFISFDRYVKISKPLQYKSRMTTSTSVKVIFIIWLISTAFATYAATPNSGSIGFFLTAANCSMLDKTKAFYTFLAVSAFFLPTTVIVVMYVLIFRVAHKRQKMLRNGELGQNVNAWNQQTTLRQDLKLIRMLLIVVGVFIFCWGSYFIWLLLDIYDPNLFEGDEDSLNYWYSYAIPQFAAVTLPQFNSLCNPIIYAYFDQMYGKAFKHLLQQIICRPSSRRRQLPNAIELRRL